MFWKTTLAEFFLKKNIVGTLKIIVFASRNAKKIKKKTIYNDITPNLQKVDVFGIFLVEYMQKRHYFSFIVENTHRNAHIMLFFYIFSMIQYIFICKKSISPQWKQLGWPRWDINLSWEGHHSGKMRKKIGGYFLPS